MTDMSRTCDTADCSNVWVWQGVIWDGDQAIQAFYCDGCRRSLGDDLEDAQRLPERAPDTSSQIPVNLGVDAYALRNAVGKWLRIKAEQPHAVGQKTATDMLVSQGAAAMYRQLAADAEHSGLLARLFKGEDPS